MAPRRGGTANAVKFAILHLITLRISTIKMWIY